MAKKHVTFQEKLKQEGKQKNLESVGEYIKDCNKKSLDCDFSDTVIRFDIDFSKYQFDNIPSLIFDKCTFYSNANFSKVHFKNKVSFNCTNFIEKVVFKESIFTSDCFFRGADFRKGADFSFAKFGKKDSKECRCDFSTKSKDHDWRTDDDGEYKFRGSMNFEGAVFYASEITFENRSFEDTIDFTLAEFHTAPYFRNCEISGDYYFTRTSFLDTRSKRAETSYRILKELMEDLRDTSLSTIFEEKQKKSRDGYLKPENRTLVKLEKLMEILKAEFEIDTSSMPCRAYDFVHNFVNKYDPSIFSKINTEAMEVKDKKNGKTYKQLPRTAKKYLSRAGFKFRQTGGKPNMDFTDILKKLK